jgi:hypothetical protein
VIDNDGAKEPRKVGSNPGCSLRWAKVGQGRDRNESVFSTLLSPRRNHRPTVWEV